MDGLIVSNHGGRQVDGAIATIEALPAVVEAVGGEEGVHHVLRCFLADLDLQAGLAGHRSVHELSRESLVRV